MNKSFVGLIIVAFCMMFLIIGMQAISESKRRSILFKEQKQNQQTQSTEFVAVKKKYHCIPLEQDILKHYRKLGYEYIEPRKLGGWNGQFECDGVKLTGNGLPDIIMDRPFRLFEEITEKESLEFILE